MYLVSHYSMTKAKMVHDDLHVNLKYNEWKISGSQSIAIATNDSLALKNSIQSVYTRLKLILAKKIDLFLSNLKEKTPEKLQSFQQRHR